MLNITLAAMPAMFLILFWIYRNSETSAKQLITRVVKLTAFAIYLFVMLYFITEVSSISDVIEGISVGPVNFKLLGSQGAATYILNVLLFVPFGFLIPAIWNKYQSLPRTILSGFLLSLNIEWLQLFNNRVTDVDDLITNTIGTLIGYVIWKMITIKGHQNENEFSKHEFWKLSASIFLGIIFFKNFFPA